MRSNNGACVSHHCKNHNRNTCTPIKTTACSRRSHTPQWDTHTSKLRTCRLLYESYCFSVRPSCPINKTTHISFQHIIRIERDYYQLLNASTDTSLTSKPKQRELIVSRSQVLLLYSEETKAVQCHLVRESKAY